ncbi:MAG: nitrilase-related carbon-nitrogen hydrolase [Candidatus Eisenbacteria bacterium]
MSVFRVVFVQGRPHFGEPAGNLERALALAADTPADLVVLPELWASGYVFSTHAEVAALAEDATRGPTARALTAAARRERRHYIGGFAERHRGRFYNSAMLVGSSGVRTVYRKLHLFEREQEWFEPGDLPLSVTRVGPARVGILICFDWRFPEAARVLALAGADVIAHPSNLVFPDAQRIMLGRAFENRVYVVTANRTGVDDRPGGRVRFTGRSQVADPDGRVLARAGAAETCARGADCDLARSRDKSLTALTHLFTSRRPEHYRPVTTMPAWGLTAPRAPRVRGRWRPR